MGSNAHAQSAKSMGEGRKTSASILGAQQSNLKLNLNMILMSIYTTEHSNVYDLHQADNLPA